MREIQIKSFIETSLVDFDGKVSSVMFLPYCNFKCNYCYNKQLVLEPWTLETISQEKIFSYLKSRKEWIDAVVITGGEPTIHGDLPELCKKIKDLGYIVKIDTNGSNPMMLEQLINKNLVDYIAMDVKNSLESEKYNKATEVVVDILKIKESIGIVKQLKDYEFRTTCVPSFVNANDLIEIAHYLNTVHANKTFFLQQFRAENLINSELEKIKPYTKEEMRQFQYLLRPYFNKVKLRGIKE